MIIIIRKHVFLQFINLLCQCAMLIFINTLKTDQIRLALTDVWQYYNKTNKILCIYIWQFMQKYIIILTCFYLFIYIILIITGKMCDEYLFLKNVSLIV